ncbi:MAG: hypothetical protein ACI9XO_002177 [Paraglaciecola sp.]
MILIENSCDFNKGSLRVEKGLQKPFSTLKSPPVLQQAARAVFISERKYTFFFHQKSQRNSGYIVLIILAMCLLNSCLSKKEKAPITPALYHWQTEVDLSDFEKKYLNDFPIQKLYLKFFDVDKENGQIVPKALIYGDSLSVILKNKTIIPTVFITNRTLKDISPPEIIDLSKKIASKINFVAKQNNLYFQEIQLDCDWTLTTKTAYFELIKSIRQQLPNEVKISATIRLHQIKFAEKTGVPPVDRGMLMYYNMGDLDNLETRNSILDNEIGQQYLKNASNYPLELDIALPIFAWGVLFRDGRMIRLINDLRATDLVDTSRFEKEDVTHFKIKKSNYLKGYYLYEGDEIRLESSPQSELENAAERLAPILNGTKRNLVFYHLDSTNLQTFPIANLKKIMNVFDTKK